MSNKISLSFFWKLLERISFHAVKLVIQIVLARILFPEDFGLLSIIMVFVEFATIFVQSGLNTALIQSRDVREEDFSTVFWLSFLLALVLYILLFFTSPIIAHFYENDTIISALRVLGLYLFAGAFNSIQIAYATKQFDFKSQFISNFIAIVISGGLGIFLALKGTGVWALIVQQIVWQFLCCVFMFVFIKWRPKLVFSKERLRPLLSFGWKMLLSNILMRSKNLACNLIVGKKYSEEELGHYSKAQNFPTAFSDVIASTFSSISLADLSTTKYDIDISKKKLLLYFEYSTIIVAPIMFGLFATSNSFIYILLSDKWLPCIPYVKIFCAIQLFQPICAISGQALSALGRSDLYLKTYLITEPLGLGLIVGGILLFDAPISIAWIVLITQIIETTILFILVKRTYQIKIWILLLKWFTSLLPAIIMFAVVYPINYFVDNKLLLLGIQVVLGLIVYACMLLVFKKRLVVNIFNKIRRKEEQNV